MAPASSTISHSASLEAGRGQQAEGALPLGWGRQALSLPYKHRLSSISNNKKPTSWKAKKGAHWVKSHTLRRKIMV